MTTCSHGWMSHTSTTHIHKNIPTLQSKGQEHIERTGSKGKRLVILHAITIDGPVCVRDENGMPMSDLTWEGDTTHPTQGDDSELTCETLWLAQSSAGDYHDNMTSDIFMRWVKEKALPCFERLYFGKKMVLIADNAAYHHKWEIGSIASLTKMKLIDLMQKHEVEYIDLPLNDLRWDYLQEHQDGEEHFEDHGDCIWIPFDLEEQKQMASQSRPLIGNVQELKIALLTYLKEERPELLECKVEKALRECGHRVLWLPLYCPELNPIELFWAAGKNHVAWCYVEKRTMMEMVTQLREGWYGNSNTHPEGHYLHKEPVDCHKLFLQAHEAARTKFIPMCKGISRTIGALEVDPDYQDDEVDIPIDALVLNLAQFNDVGDKMGDQN